MTLSRTFARCFVHLCLVVGFLGCGVSISESMAPTVRTDSPSTSECFNSSTGQIFTIAAGETCP